MQNDVESPCLLHVGVAHWTLTSFNIYFRTDDRSDDFTMTPIETNNIYVILMHHHYHSLSLYSPELSALTPESAQAPIMAHHFDKVSSSPLLRTQS